MFCAYKSLAKFPIFCESMLNTSLTVRCLFPQQLAIIDFNSYNISIVIEKSEGHEIQSKQVQNFHQTSQCGNLIRFSSGCLLRANRVNLLIHLDGWENESCLLSTIIIMIMSKANEMVVVVHIHTPPYKIGKKLLGRFNS